MRRFPGASLFVGVPTICGRCFASPTYGLQALTNRQGLADQSTEAASPPNNDGNLRALVSLSDPTTITTTQCPIIRTEPFRARLDVFFYYLVEFTNETTPDLPGVERSIANQLADALHQCGEEQYAFYAVQISGEGHRFAESESCASSQSNVACRIVRGVTSILLDQDAALAELIAYDTVGQVLNNLAVLNQFTTSNFVHTEFVKRIGENLVVLDSTHPNGNQGTDNGGNDDDSSNSTTKIAVASAVTAFVLTSLFAYGMYRHQQALMADEVGNASNKMRATYYGAKRRKFWDQLEEGSRSPGWMVAADQIPSVTWSVSDLSNDSESIKSALKMDSIDEEEEESSKDVEVGTPERKRTSLASVSLPGGPYDDDQEDIEGDSTPTLSVHQLNFISHWKNHKREMMRSQKDGAAATTQDSGQASLGMVSTIWDHLACMPPSHMDDSDPDAGTPVRSNRIEDFDVTASSESALGGISSPSGCQFLLDSSSDEDEDSLHGCPLDLDHYNRTDPTDESGLVDDDACSSPGSSKNCFVLEDDDSSELTVSSREGISSHENEEEEKFDIGSEDEDALDTVSEDEDAFDISSEDVEVFDGGSSSSETDSEQGTGDEASVVTVEQSFVKSSLSSHKDPLNEDDNENAAKVEDEKEKEVTWDTEEEVTIVFGSPDRVSVGSSDYAEFKTPCQRVEDISVEETATAATPSPRAQQEQQQRLDQAVIAWVLRVMTTLAVGEHQKRITM